MSKKLFLSFVLALLVMSPFAVSAMAKTNDVICPKDSAVECNVISPENMESLEGFALDEGVGETTRTYLSYGSETDQRRMYVGKVLNGENYFENFTDRVMLYSNDRVGITHMGIRFNEGMFELWQPVNITAEEDGTPIMVTSLQAPVQMHYTAMLGKDFVTYWWARYDLILIYYWDLSQTDDTLVITINQINIQWFPVPNGWPREEDVAFAGTTEVVDPIHRNLWRGQQLTVTEVYTASDFKSETQQTNWVIERNRLTHIELQDPSTGKFIVSLEDVYITDTCGSEYRPFVGDTLYVIETHNTVSLSNVRPDRMLRQDETNELSSINAKSKLTMFDGVIVSERWDDQGSWPQYYFTLQQADGTLTEFKYFEWQVPPVGTSVSVHTLDSGYILGIQLYRSDFWWSLNVETALWQTCEQ